MTLPRHQIVDPTTPGHYHCVSRCVRRAWLCGADPVSGQSFEHRKDWIEARLLELSELFAVGLYAYAVMSNHVHVVLQVDPTAVAAWSDEDVTRRWVRLFPVRERGLISEARTALKAQVILAHPERLATCRQRLGSLSWFMRCLNEPIARQANREDGCTGRFWEGRYKCQALLDEAALLACMCYVDLNPVRAGMAQDLPASAHTSVRRRLNEAADRPLVAVRTCLQGTDLSIRQDAYLALVDWTGRQLRPDKRGAIAAHVPPVLQQMGLRESQWKAQVLGIENRYWRAIGSVEALLEKARAIGQCWLKGLGTCRRLAQASG